MSVSCEALAVVSCSIYVKSLCVFSSSFLSCNWSSFWALRCWSAACLKVASAVLVKEFVLLYAKLAI